MIIALAIAVGVIALDQLTKYWARTVLKAVADIPLWNGVFHFHYAENTGAAFSMLSGHSLLFFILTILVVLALLVYLVLYRKKIDLLQKITLGLIIGGAVGNLVDRIAYGYVIDFLYFKLINFAIFNVADSCLVIGCLLLAVYVLFLRERVKKGKTEIADGKQDPPAEDGN